MSCVCATVSIRLAEEKYEHREMRLLERVGRSGVESAQCCVLSPLQTETILGLRTYVHKYGQMSEDVALGEDHV